MIFSIYVHKWRYPNSSKYITNLIISYKKNIKKILQHIIDQPSPWSCESRRLDIYPMLEKWKLRKIFSKIIELQYTASLITTFNQQIFNGLKVFCELFLSERKNK